MRKKIIEWFARGDVGLSSRAMAMVLAGIPLRKHDKFHPLDPSDVRRCLLFLEAVPEAREQMDCFREISDEWNSLIDNWKEIEATLLEEMGLYPKSGAFAPKTYALMKRILGKNSSERRER
jgi:hypothetical protein